MLFEPFSIGPLRFKNRIVRSSIGGRTAQFDGAVTPAFAQFEQRFARNEVAAIISATIAVSDRRASPMQYPRLTHDRFIAPFREAVKGVQRFDCRYIVQLGDPGGHTQTSLFAEREDALSSSNAFDLFYGYTNRHLAMSVEEIAQLVNEFAQAARRVREIGADGLEITASKGYIIHQFLNPGINRRTDAYGGSVAKRFQLLEEVVRAVREQIGRDFPLGIRLSAADHNHSPLNLRLPVRFPLRHWWSGNTIVENLQYAHQLKALGVDYLHIDEGFGFINPRGNPGSFPAAEIRQFYNANKHLSFKARVRAALAHAIPLAVLQPLVNIGWKDVPAISAHHARRFKHEVGLPVISNGGYQERAVIDGVLRDGMADLVAMARPLLANVDLLKRFRAGANAAERPCTHCNRCAVRTANFPLGCYDRSRFASQDEMEEAILRWSSARAEGEE